MITKLTVLPAQDVWFSDGLDFTCTQCGNCCSGPAGFVWITKDEIVRLAEHLNVTPEETVEQYCRKVSGQFSLRETANSRGEYDCIFLRDEPALQSNGVTHSRRVCGIYPVRPLQCRTWPFWSGNLRSKSAWDTAAIRCHGMNQGRHYSPEQILELEAAADWPSHPPGSTPTSQ